MTVRSRSLHLAVAGLAALALTAAACENPPVGPTTPTTEPPVVDAVNSRVVAELRSFVGWLDEFDQRGYIGELGWPKDGDVAQWNTVGESWYRVADAAGLWTTQWSATKFWRSTYPLSVYQWDPPWRPTPSAAVLEAHPSRNGFLRGVTSDGGSNAGSNIGTGTEDYFCNRNIGNYVGDYDFDDTETFEYLASRGVKLVRIGVRWERIQQQPFAELDPTEFGRLRTAVEEARAAGLEVVVNLHNFGAYWSCDTPDGSVRRLPVGTPELPSQALADVWWRLSLALGDLDGVHYGLMNEPVGLEEAGGRTPAEVWEQASQEAVDAIRANNDDALIMVPGYDWSSAERWRSNHPDPWIEDPAGNIRYEAHHYWDSTGAGHYGPSYEDERTWSEQEGYEPAPQPLPAP